MDIQLGILGDIAWNCKPFSKGVLDAPGRDEKKDLRIAQVLSSSRVEGAAVLHPSRNA
jgi:hypothetical protein